MGFIGKLFAVVMLPLSVLIVLEQLGILSYPLPLPFSNVQTGAGLMIILELLTVLFLALIYKKLSFMNVVTALAFLSVAAGAVVAIMTGFYPKEAALVMAAAMFVEALFALH